MRTLCAVADAGSLNRASTHLELPQPALSRQVRRLENLLGGALFHRSKKGVQPTQLGSTVLAHAESVLSVCDSLSRELEAQRINQESTVRVGWATSSLPDLLLHSIRKLLPHEVIQVRVGDSTTQVAEWLDNGELDLALFMKVSDAKVCSSDLVGEFAIAEDEVLIALPAGHPLASKRVVRLVDLGDEEWIYHANRDGCQHFLPSVFGPLGITPKLVHNIPVAGPREDVVRCQGSVTFVQALRAPSPGIVRRPVTDLPFRSRHCLAFRKDGPIAPCIPLLGSSIIDAYWAKFQSHESESPWSAQLRALDKPSLSVAGRLAHTS